MKEFLKKLKVGDKVIIKYHSSRAVCVIEEITKAGNFRVNGVLFNSDGAERGGDIYSKWYLDEATPEAVEAVEREMVIHNAKVILRKAERKVITYEQALQIIEIFKQTESEGSK